MGSAASVKIRNGAGALGVHGNDLRVVAQSIALETRRRVLILVGRLDGTMGLPRTIDRYAADIELRMMSSITAHVTTGIFEVKDEDSLCAAIDQLQENGGYRATVVNTDGSIDPAYTI